MYKGKSAGVLDAKRITAQTNDNQFIRQIFPKGNMEGKKYLGILAFFKTEKNVFIVIYGKMCRRAG